MKIAGIASGGDGKSRFYDLGLALSTKGHFGRFSELQAAPGVLFREVDAAYDSGWHVAPNPLYMIILSGAIEITTGSGETRHFTPGSVIYAEDTEGAGHRTQCVDERGFTSIIVNLSGRARAA